MIRKCICAIRQSSIRKNPKASLFLGVEQILFTCINGLEQATQNDVEGGHKPKTTLILRQKKFEGFQT